MTQSRPGRRGVLGVDTNVLVRFLVKDDRRQTAIAEDFFRKRLSFSVPGFINLVVLCETVWVLERTYGYPRTKVAEVIGSILNTAELVLEDPRAVEMALEVFRETSVDFADALIAIHNHNNGCSATVTFDKALVRSGLAHEL